MDLERPVKTPLLKILVYAALNPSLWGLKLLVYVDLERPDNTPFLLLDWRRLYGL